MLGKAPANKKLSPAFNMALKLWTHTVIIKVFLFAN